MKLDYSCKVRWKFLFASCAMLLLSQFAGAAAQAQDDDLQARLEQIEKRFEEERVKNHIPGLALAVIKDDKVILAKGFGHRDLENEIPVTPDTHFAIGSSTKAFTSTLVAMLVDDEVLEFDSPAEKYIPGLKMQVDTGDESITFRDLMSHRTGFTRMGVLWAAGKTTREEVIEMAGQAEPVDDFRDKFHYNNVTYMMAGYGAGKATDSDWDTLVKSRIFEPLGMGESNTTISDAQKNPKLSKGYVWDVDREIYKELPMRRLDNIGPAGSINSNVLDMAQWVRLQLGKGEFEGNRLVSEASLEETWTKQINIAPGHGYGLGWMVHEWNGHKLIEHGGNIDGFAASVGFLPDEQVGYVMLANVTATPLQQGAIEIVFSGLLNELAEDTGDAEAAATTEDTSKLEGVYLANFAQFKETEFTVLKKDGKLAVDIPGQTTFELKQPDEDGKRYFALTDQIAVSFALKDDGEAFSMTLYQSGVEFECFRNGVEVPIEVPLAELQPLIGSYKDPVEDAIIKVLIQNNRLMIVAPNLGTVGLFPPNDEGLWGFRFRPGSGGLKFNRDDDGNVESITRVNGEREVILSKIEDESVVALPSIDELAALMRDAVNPDGVKLPKGIRADGAVRFVNQGATGKLTVIFDDEDRHGTMMDLGKLGYINGSYDGEKGWSDSTFGQFEEVLGPRLQAMQVTHPLWVLGDWADSYDSVTILDTVDVDGTQAFQVRLAAKDVPDRTIYVGIESGLVLKEDAAEILPGIGSLPITKTFSDYRAVDGIMIPFESSVSNSQTGKTVIQIEEVESDVTFEEGAFTLQPPADSE